jgi:hypothetical protein
MDLARSIEEKATGEKDSRGRKNQAKDNEQNLAAFGWAGHNEIIELP